MLALAEFALFALSGRQGDVVKAFAVLKEEVGFQRATFTSSKGTVTVILPSEITQGDTISGTFFLDVKAKDVTDVQIDLGKSHGPPPEISNSPRRIWTVPLDSEPRLSLTVWTPDGVSFGTTYVSVGAKKPNPSQYNIPNFLRVSASGTIFGPFDGDAGNTRITATGVQCSVIAESPRASTFLVPTSMKLGLSTLELTEGKQSVESLTRMLSVKISSPRTTLNKNDVSSVTINVDGLNGVTDDRSPMVIVENLTPKVIDLEGKVKHYLFAKPLEDGTYSKTLSIQSILTGGFAIGATVDPGPGTKVNPKSVDMFDHRQIVRNY